MTDHARAIEAGARAAFIAAHKHLDLTETKDAWGEPMFVHSHVEAMWSGWKAALASGELVPARAVAAERERCAKVADGFIEIVDKQARPLRHKIMMEKLVWDIAAAIRALSPDPASGDFVVVPRADLARVVEIAHCHAVAPEIGRVRAMLRAATKDGERK